MPTGASNIKTIWKQGQQNVTGEDISRGAAVGITERGVVGVRTTVFSKEEYRKYYGGYVENNDSDLSIAVDSFFDNGGTALDVVRTCHYTDISNPTSYTATIGTLDLITYTSGSPTAGQETSSGSEPFELSAADTLLIDPDAGGNQTITFNATAGYVDTNETFPVSDQSGLTLRLAADGGSTFEVTFGTATTIAELAQDINAAGIPGLHAYESGGELRVQSDTKGTGSSIAIIAGGTNTLTWATPVSGTGDVANIFAVTAAEAKSHIEATLTGASVNIETGGEITVISATTGASSSVQITGTAQTKFGFDGALHSGSDVGTITTLTVDGKTPGAYANSLYPVVADASNGEAAFFDFSMSLNGEAQESWPNVTMDPDDDRYIVSIVNNELTGSDLITLTDADLIGGSGYTPLEARPENGTWGPLTGGNDGLSGLLDTDFVGSSSGYTGLYALDDEEDIRLFTIPGHASATVHAGITAYIEHRNRGIYGVQPTPGPTQVASASAMKTWSQNYLMNTSEFACCAWPRIKIPNPSSAVFGDVETVTVGSEMSKMGRFAYNDRFNADGVFVSTAGIKDNRGVIINCLGVEFDDLKISAKADLIANVNIEPIRKFKNTSYHFDGGDNLKINADWPRQWHARGAIFVVKSLESNALWVKHSKNNAKNRGDWERQGNRFLTTLPADAFDEARPTFWQVSDALNGPEIRAQQRMRGRLGLGFSDDAKYVEIIVSRTVAAG